jgi:cytochrome c oxidase assembly protein subunit 11
MDMQPRRGNKAVALALVGIVAGMGGLAFASVPLYRLFCAATGFGGTPSIGPAAAPGAIARRITVRFNADTNPGLPWQFQPSQAQITLPLGEQELAFYNARNLAGTPVTGTAVYNVTPEKVGRYFHKTACFCFNEQTLAAGQQMEFPVSFWVDPKLADDPNTADVTTITLSYTFFRTLEDAARAGMLAATGPHVGPASANNRSSTP